MPRISTTSAKQIMNERQSEDLAAETAGRSNSTATLPEQPGSCEYQEAGEQGDSNLDHNPVNACFSRESYHEAPANKAILPKTKNYMGVCPNPA